MNRCSALILVIAACLCSGARVHAHEIGTTRVAAVFHDSRRYDIEIVTDAGALREKLDASAGPTDLRSPVASFGGPPEPWRRRTGPALPLSQPSPPLLEQRLVALDEIFRTRVAVSFDGAAVRPAIAYSVAPAADAASPPLATIRLSGEVPSNARRFTWAYSWTFASYALTCRNAGSENLATEWLEGGQTSGPFPLAAPPPAPGRLATAWRYLALGFTHIVPHGLDHVLFVIGIFFLSARLRSVLWQVSAFTVAHSITLGLSISGVLAVPPAVVEPLIAVSIAYVAIENLFLRELKPWRIALVFAFGLLHGMGFAGVLQELGLPRSEFLTALVTFNAGIEAGQLAVIAAAFLLVGWPCGGRIWYRRRIVVPASFLIACMALYWTAQRTLFASL